MTLPTALRCIRKSAGVSQEVVARLLGVSWGSVSRWEKSNGRQPEPDRMARLDRLMYLMYHFDTFVSEDLVRYMETANLEFRGCRPKDMIQSAYSFGVLLEHCGIPGFYEPGWWKRLQVTDLKVQDEDKK